MQVEAYRNTFPLRLSLLYVKKQQRERLLNELQEQTLINESILLSRRAQLRKEQAKQILSAYDLYELNWSYPQFSIAKELKFEEYDCVSGVGGKMYSNRDMKVLFKMYFFGSLSDEHKLICSYSLVNLLRFIQCVNVFKRF